MASQYKAVSVTSTATQILAANNARKSAVIYNNGSVAVYLGFDSSVTTSNGLPLLPQSAWNNNGEFDSWRGAIYGITASSSSDTRLMEWEN